MEPNRASARKLVRASPNKQPYGGQNGGYFVIGEAGLAIGLELVPLNDPRSDLREETSRHKL